MKVTKIKSKQYHVRFRFRFLEENWKYQMPILTEDLDEAIAEVIGTFDGVVSMWRMINAELREGIVNYDQRKDILAPSLPSPC